MLSFGGFALGAFLGTRLGPLLLPRGSSSPYAPAFGLIGALLAGAILASGLEGLGFRLRRALFLPGLGLLDGLLGAALGAALGLGIVWILAAVAAQTPGQGRLRADIQRSAVLRELNQLLPPTGLDPERARAAGPAASGRGALAGCRRAPARRRARAGCAQRLAQRRARARHRLRPGDRGLGLGGQPEIVVTNAHVLAGEQDTTVELGGYSPSLPARAIAFDPTDDIALLRVPDLAVPALSLVSEPARAPPARSSAIRRTAPSTCSPAGSGARRR